MRTTEGCICDREVNDTVDHRWRGRQTLRMNLGMPENGTSLCLKGIGIATTHAGTRIDHSVVQRESSSATPRAPIITRHMMRPMDRTVFPTYGRHDAIL